MCDTLCALPGETKNGAAILAKNSDREPNEPHVIRFVPAGEHAECGKVRCTYIEIPQARHTNAVLLLKPSWIWGAEMGVNEHGVAIGNEAVFTKAKKGPDALIGMDLLRLALERADTAEAAADTIVRLLKEFGQGGNCGYSKDFRYDNSFLIADKKYAYILETSGKNYAVSPVKGKVAISNRLFIRGEHTRREGIAECEDFAGRFTEPVFSFFAKGKARRCQSLSALSESPVTVGSMMRALRTHAPGVDGREFSRGSVGSVCMHAGGIIGDHTTGSFVAVLREGAPMTIWATGASTPCIAAFKPVFFGMEQPPVFADEALGKEYWLKRERLHRAVISGQIDVKAFRQRRDALEAAWLDEEERLFSTSVPEEQRLKEFAVRAAAAEQALVDEFSTESWNAMKGVSRFARYWRDENAKL
jgi:secernin